jgi:hypothetical protein
MYTIAVIASYALAVFSSIVPIGLLVLEVDQRIRRGEAVLIPFVYEFAIVVTLTVFLVWIVRGIMDDPGLMLLFFGIFNLWLISMAWWIYDTLKHSSSVFVITELERNL